MRVQSLPANCAAFIRITPATIGGYLKPPPSSRFQYIKAAAIPDDNLIGALCTEDHRRPPYRVMPQRLLSQRAPSHPHPSGSSQVGSQRKS